MPLKLSSPVTDIPRIGPTKAKYLIKLGIVHVRDLLYTFPRRYDDFSTVTPINELKDGQILTVRGKVKKVTSKWGFRGRQRLLRIFVDIEDGTGTLAVTWFNLRFLPRQLWQGRELYVAGKVELDNTSPPAPLLLKEKGVKRKFRMRSPVLEFIDLSTSSGQVSEQTHTARITPVYPETYGVTSRFLRYQVKNTLPLINIIPEYLPENIRRRNKLIGIHRAISAAHFPDSTRQLKVAQQRLRFDELFFLQLAALVRRRDRQQQNSVSIRQAPTLLKSFIKNLPYSLTNAQHQALGEIVHDLARRTPMNRLLQGDVGSGKSVIAQAITHLALNRRHQVLYLAPTEVLARQQFESFRDMLGRENVKLLFGAMPKRERDKIKSALASPQPLCVIGTHAILQDDVSAHSLALVIVDEQHRFGVKQRQALQGVRNPGKKVPDTLPHLLSMTATPIPRTLNLTVFGDLDVSILNELPPGRQPIQTKIIPAAQRDQVTVQILGQLHQGRQAYVVAPLVEKSDKLEVKSAKETAAQMKKFFPGVAVSLLHGQMTSAEKEQVLRNFTAGAIQLLVATSIVEVGINVANATIMIIEGAERFGLSQLHQFRGRIGRGQHQSTCFLFPTTDEGLNNPRLQALASTTDGFAIAEEDLRLRGPGEAYGVAQSGFGNLKVASLLDYPMIKLARTEAAKLLAKDPQLKKYPILRKKVEQKNLVAHFE